MSVTDSKSNSQPLARGHRLQRLWQLAHWAAVLLIARVALGILSGYHDYFPLNFHSFFLSGRKSYFFGIYSLAFWVHIFASPLAIICGLWLLSSQQRLLFPALHRRLGRLQLLTILFLVAPSGLWLSCYALTGWSSGSAFAFSSIAIFVCAALGWRCAILRQFGTHRTWMIRCYLLLCSAIVLRVLSGAATVLHIQPIESYALCAWTSTVVPLGIYESARRILPTSARR